MIIIALVWLGLCLGSFTNALVWRLRQQELAEEAATYPLKKAATKVKTKLLKTKLPDYSITRGRSMCPNCHHQLAAKDLIPVLSWLQLRGKCRYCRKPVPWQYPVVELATAGLFVGCFIFWPDTLKNWGIIIFGIWMLQLVCLVALLVYDLKWMLLPNRIVFPLTGLALLQSLIAAALSGHFIKSLGGAALAAAIGGGIFWGLYQISRGRWIGGGDVKLGFALGLIIGSPLKSLLVIFLAACLGSAISLPLLASKRLRLKAQVPFGPFLIMATVIVRLFGSAILVWYTRTFLQTGL